MTDRHCRTHLEGREVEDRQIAPGTEVVTAAQDQCADLRICIQRPQRLGYSFHQRHIQCITPLGSVERHDGHGTLPRSGNQFRHWGPFGDYAGIVVRLLTPTGPEYNLCVASK